MNLKYIKQYEEGKKERESKKKIEIQLLSHTHTQKQTQSQKKNAICIFLCSIFKKRERKNRFFLH